jgi:hypothetical protein
MLNFNKTDDVNIIECISTNSKNIELCGYYSLSLHFFDYTIHKKKVLEKFDKHLGNIGFLDKIIFYLLTDEILKKLIS